MIWGAPIFGLSPGEAFAPSLVAGLRARLAGDPPEAMARIRLYLNTRRAARAVTAEFARSGGTGFLPRIGVIDDIARDFGIDLGPTADPLARQMTLAADIDLFLERAGAFAPRTARFELAASLMAFEDELDGRSVPTSALHDIDAGDVAAHWQATLAFLRVLEASNGEAPLTPERHRRQTADALLAAWQADPPRDPVLIAGSTGSRPATSDIMAAVAKLPSGAIILPGLDPGFRPSDIKALGEEHPQQRVLSFLHRIGLLQSPVETWNDKSLVSPRQTLVSVALRPAPVTDCWRQEAPALRRIVAEATADLTLLETERPREEALCIALAMREALEDPGKRVALITPDRTLARQVVAEMSRWSLVPDDSAGRPLHLTPVGVFVRMIAQLFGADAAPAGLIALLKHPHCGGAGEVRRRHMMQTLSLEVWLRREGIPSLDSAALAAWVKDRHDPVAADWAHWLETILTDLAHGVTGPLAALSDRLSDLATRLHQGLEADATIWSSGDGLIVADILERMGDATLPDDGLSPREFAGLLERLLAAENLPEQSERTDPRVAILGTLEARTESADVIILGGLNEGVWPRQPDPDPWLARPFRKTLGLPMPERRLGLSAHDFQNAVCMPRVILTRAMRVDGTPTVASRWITRLTSLIGGVGDEGNAALDAMRARGQRLCDIARLVDRPEARVLPARRPAPRPPASVRPRKFSVTEIERLIRDPYAIYARRILHLRPLDPFGRPPDARDRGTALHKVMEAFGEATGTGPLPHDAADILAATAARVIDTEAPWPTQRRLWRARVARVAPVYLPWEARQRDAGTRLGVEVRGARDFVVNDEDFILTGSADRIDRRKDGTLLILDYKTGSVPTKANIRAYAIQLWLEAAISESGGFTGLVQAPIGAAAYVGLAAQSAKEIELIETMTQDEVASNWDRFVALIAHFSMEETAYTPFRIGYDDRFVGDYDHLSRFGEWDGAPEP